MPLVTEQRGAAIRIVRAVKDMTQAELGRRTGISQGRISQIEQDHTRATTDEWTRIWKVLSTDDPTD